MNSGKNPSMINRPNLQVLALLTLTMAGCSTFSRSNSEAENAAEKDGNNRYSAMEPASSDNLKDQKIKHLEATVGTLNGKIQELEGKLLAHPTYSKAMDPVVKIQKRQQADDAALLGAKVSASIAANDPGAGFVNDAPVRAYQQGRMLFDQEKFPEAILAFSAFLEQNPGHSLASSAQYTIAESYYREGDYGVADTEFQKLATRYPNSPRVSFALVRLSQSATALGKTEEAKRYRTQVEGLFPKSPALKLFREAPVSANDAAHSVAPIATAPDLTIANPTVPAIPVPTIEQLTIERPTIDQPRVEVPTGKAPRARVSSDDLDAPPGGGG